MKNLNARVSSETLQFVRNLQGWLFVSQQDVVRKAIEALHTAEAARRDTTPVVIAHYAETVTTPEACGDCGTTITTGQRERWDNGRIGALICAGCIK